MGKYFNPIEGVDIPIQATSHSVSEGKLHEDKIGISIGPVNICYCEDKGVLHLSYDSPCLAFSAESTVTGAGQLLRNQVAQDGHVENRYFPHAPTIVTLTHLPMNSSNNTSIPITFQGFGWHYHLTQTLKPFKISDHTEFVVAHLKELDGSLSPYSFLTSRVRTSRHYNGEYLTNFILVDSGRIIATSQHISANYSSDKELHKSSGHSVTTQVDYSVRGSLLSCPESDFEVAFSINCGAGKPKLLEAIDVLSQVPYLIRKVIQSFLSKPFVFSYTGTENPVSLKIGDGPVKEYSAVYYHELGYITD